jgi:hypothetical protein
MNPSDALQTHAEVDMARTYHEDIVVLPRLNAGSADALVTALLAQAKGKKVSKTIERARENLARSHKLLQDARGARLKPPPAESPRALEADRVEDNAFAAFHQFLSAWARLPTDDGANARLVLNGLFPDGLRFTLLPYKQEWAEADARLRVLKEHPDYEQTVKKLGGEPFVSHLARAHKNYGEILGVTVAAQEDDGSKPATVRETMASLLAATRTYAIRVMAHADPDDDGASALSEDLLAPLIAWRDDRKAPRAADAPPPPAPPEEPPAPPPAAVPEEPPASST